MKKKIGVIGGGIIGLSLAYKLLLKHPNSKIYLFEKLKIKKKISSVKKAVKLKTPPERCYNPIPDGKSGNMQLPKGCVYCRHKFECHKDANEGKGLRVFKYSTGYRYLTQVPKVPNVIEVTQI